MNSSTKQCDSPCCWRRTAAGPRRTSRVDRLRRPARIWSRVAAKTLTGKARLDADRRRTGRSPKTKLSSLASPPSVKPGENLDPPPKPRAVRTSNRDSNRPPCASATHRAVVEKPKSSKPVSEPTPQKCRVRCRPWLREDADCPAEGPQLLPGVTAAAPGQELPGRAAGRRGLCQEQDIVVRQRLHAPSSICAAAARASG